MHPNVIALAQLETVLQARVAIVIQPRALLHGVLLLQSYWRTHARTLNSQESSKCRKGTTAQAYII